MKTSTLCHEYNKLPFWEIFVTLNFSIVLLVVQIKSQNPDIDFGGRL